MAKIIAICNQKGGVGKTSTAVSLSAGLALEGRKVLLVDLDPQGNATSGLGIDKKSLQQSVYHGILDNQPLENVWVKTEIDNLWVAPSNPDLSGAEVELTTEIGRENRLKKFLSQTPPDIDFVFVDCPPSFGLLTINALTAAHTVLIPIQCEYFALEGLSQLINTIQLVKDNINASLGIEGILMTMADFRTNLTQEVIKEVQKHFGEKVYRTVIPRNIKLGEAPGFGKPIFLYDKDSEGAKKYKEFVLEFLAAYTVAPQAELAESSAQAPAAEAPVEQSMPEPQPAVAQPENHS